jgi:transcriptional regulator GlxA family with amidase domain
VEALACRLLGGPIRTDQRVNAGKSSRTFARLYLARTGRTPAKAVEELRLEAARRALEETQLSLKEIASRSGFFDEERMRRAFHRGLGVSPQDYRSKFGSGKVN